ncbi:hypothetical protein SAMD00023520_01095 [Listeria monocytogenes]|nr:hypothetical protein SAMD00023518_01710 [Listeria monocytogenes]GAT38718.1 hypothetical protein SAMD00023519_00884 [Listeria monocytogenes]GAT41142.1 hypothetical protein SAMD00023520_01095 [Listeria monocytogenes]
MQGFRFLRLPLCQPGNIKHKICQSLRNQNQKEFRKLLLFLLRL